MKLKIDGKEVETKVLLDSGANVFLISPLFCDKWNVPKVKRDVPIKVLNFSGEVGLGA